MSLHSFATLGHVPDSLDEMLKRVAEMHFARLSKSWILMHLLWTYVQFSRRPPPNVLVALKENVTNGMPNLWKAGGKTDEPAVQWCRITSASPNIDAL